MSTFDCPHCNAHHNINRYPDHLTDMRNNRFTFECDCGAEFECTVDWDPDITPDESSLKLPRVPSDGPAMKRVRDLIEARRGNVEMGK